MSYDFDMVVDVGHPDGDVSCQSDNLNYTYNVGAMFQAALGRDGVRGLSGKTGRDCVDLLRVAIKDMEDKPEKYRAMNPVNGWGDSEGALVVLRTLLQWCLDYPAAKVRVS